jgi:hypothetical protein
VAPVASVVAWEEKEGLCVDEERDRVKVVKEMVVCRMRYASMERCE